MVKSVDELKDLIIWLKSQRVKSLKLGEVTVELSDYAFIESLSDEAPAPADKTSQKPETDGTLDQSALFGDTDDDAVLYHSSRS